MKIILFQPQIPQNTGNIVRTCSVTGTSLSLVKPLGFDTSDRMLKRAGLDYWEGVEVSFLDNLEIFLQETTQPFYFFSSKATQTYTEIPFTSDSILIFGAETHGLPESLWEKYSDRFYAIPMKEESRCLNLATSAGIVLYEGLRQLNFATLGLKKH